MIQHRETKTISPEALKTLLKTEKAPLLLDPLTRGRFKQVHLNGAQNACVFETTFLDQVAELSSDKDQPIVIYGANDQTLDAASAAAKLTRAGYTDVAILLGGLAAWQGAGLPVEGEGLESRGSTGLGLADGVYTLHLDKSRIEWTGRNVGSSHWGTLQFSRGTIQIEGGEISGAFVLDMTSIDSPRSRW